MPLLERVATLLKLGIPFLLATEEAVDDVKTQGAHCREARSSSQHLLTIGPVSSSGRTLVAGLAADKSKKRLFLSLTPG
jgi:hypothetical protein